jgi:hypothetical protein
MKYDAQSFHFSDEAIMKMLVGLVGTALMLSSAVFAQHVSGGAHGGGGEMHGVGGGHIPAHGPPPTRARPRFPVGGGEAATPTMSGGISPTTCGWARMSTSRTWGNEVRHVDGIGASHVGP